MEERVLAGEDGADLIGDEINHGGSFLVEYIEHKDNLLGNKDYDQDSCQQIIIATFGFSFHNSL